MDKITDSAIYNEDLELILNQQCDWNLLRGKTVLISGATGLIGTLLVDMLCLLNQTFSLKLHLLLVSRNQHHASYDFINFITQDIAEPLELDERIDFIIHAASNTHPLQYSQFPVETIRTNVWGTYNLLDLARKNAGCRFLFLSSVEIYGDDLNDCSHGFSESDMGYLDCNSTRACYNEGKRLGETLCASFFSEYDVDYVVARLCRCYGATLKKDDSKALTQFLRNAARGENIVLKSEGSQFYSFLYAPDAASSLLFLLLNGKKGEAYNVSDENSNITLRELAELVSDIAGTKVVFDFPNDIEQKGFSRSQKAILSPCKLHELGWHSNFTLHEGIERTLSLLRELQ